MEKIGEGKANSIDSFSRLPHDHLFIIIRYHSSAQQVLMASSTKPRTESREKSSLSRRLDWKQKMKEYPVLPFERLACKFAPLFIDDYGYCVCLC